MTQPEDDKTFYSRTSVLERFKWQKTMDLFPFGPFTSNLVMSPENYHTYQWEGGIYNSFTDDDPITCRKRGGVITEGGESADKGKCMVPKCAFSNEAESDCCNNSEANGFVKSDGCRAKARDMPLEEIINEDGRRIQNYLKRIQDINNAWMSSQDNEDKLQQGISEAKRLLLESRAVVANLEQSIEKQRVGLNEEIEAKNMQIEDLNNKIQLMKQSGTSAKTLQTSLNEKIDTQKIALIITGTSFGLLIMALVVYLINYYIKKRKRNK